MKNIFYYILLVSALGAGCRGEDDDALLGRPEDRSKEMLATYRAQLLDSPYGWKGFVFPGGGGGFSFLFEFSSEGRVTMVADINDDCATEPYESSFRLEAVQRPSLFFDTYSYLHILSDPNPDTLGGVLGQGLLSDFEFAFESTKGDTIYLKGNQNGTPLVMIKASQEEWEGYHGGALKTIPFAFDAYGKENPFIYIQSNDGKRINTSINLDAKKFSLSYKQGDTLNITSTPFGYTTLGIYLQKPLKYRNIEFQEVFFDAVQRSHYILVNGTRTDLRASEEPVLALHLFLGVDFSVISVPPRQIEGWSQSFLFMGGQLATLLMNAGLELSYMEFEFNADNKTMNFNVFMIDVSTGRLYLAQYPYTYTKSINGVFKFLPIDEANANAEYIRPVSAPLLYYFDNYRFRMEYLKTADGYVAQMTCVESPAFYFSGNFGSAIF
jgi:hypothetical protein